MPRSVPSGSFLLFAAGVPLLLLGTLAALARSSLLAESDALELALTADLLITVPVVYFLLIRKTEIPKTTVGPVMLAGLLIGSFLLPANRQNYLDLFKTWALPVVEIGILAFVIWKVRQVLVRYRRERQTTPDFYQALQSVCRELMRNRLAAAAFATEVAVFYFGFLQWKVPRPAENEFTYHRESGTPALLGAFVFLIGIETVALHILLSLWSEVLAWVLTGLSIYTALQVFGFARSLARRPIAFHAGSLNLRYGILNEGEIPYDDIERVELSGKPLEEAPFAGLLSPLGELESHNVILHLKREVELAGLYGVRKRLRVIGLHLDEPRAFQHKLAQAIRAET